LHPAVAFQKKAVSHLLPGLFSVRLLAEFRSQFSAVPVVSHAAGVKMEPVKVAKVIRSEKGKDILVFKGFKLRFQKLFPKICNDGVVLSKKYKCCIKCNESREIFRRNVLHNHDAGSEDCLKRQIFNNSVIRKAMEDLCEKPPN